MPLQNHLALHSHQCVICNFSKWHKHYREQEEAVVCLSFVNFKIYIFLYPLKVF